MAFRSVAKFSDDELLILWSGHRRELALCPEYPDEPDCQPEAELREEIEQLAVEMIRRGMAVRLH